MPESADAGLAERGRGRGVFLANNAGLGFMAAQQAQGVRER
ncbi:MAG TPA: hypothetical protein VMA73_14960 [Streptosporangiaceae bacterium]|nr:hypothetical protein [Streptosporangiaceae bacterium]